MAVEEGTGGVGGVSISGATAFVTEFNQNVAIFMAATEMVLSTLAYSQAAYAEARGVRDRANENSRKAKSNRRSIDLLKLRIDALKGQIGADNSAFMTERDRGHSSSHQIMQVVTGGD